MIYIPHITLNRLAVISKVRCSFEKSMNNFVFVMKLFSLQSRACNKREKSSWRNYLYNFDGKPQNASI